MSRRGIAVGAAAFALHAAPARASSCSNGQPVQTSAVRVQVYWKAVPPETFAPMPSAHVRLMSRGGDRLITSATADEQGYVHLSDVAPGEYDLVAEMNGFLGHMVPLTVAPKAPRRLVAFFLAFGMDCSWSCPVRAREGPLKAPPKKCDQPKRG